MRVFERSGTAGAGLCLAWALNFGGSTAPPPQPQGQAPPPAPSPAASEAAVGILADARQALGGEPKLSKLKNFVATGRTRRVTGDQLIPIEFEIAVELPDKYVRKDEIPAQETEPSSNGFSGDALIQIPPPPTPAASAKPAPGDPRAARVLANKQDFARLMLGMFATSFPGYPLTFALVGQAEAPQGRADVIEARGAGNFLVRLFIASDTHLPLMISWQSPPAPANLVLVVEGQPAPATLPPGGIVVTVPAAPPATAPQDQKDQYAKAVAAARGKAIAANRIENRIYYADYRDTDGIQVPFRLRRSIAGATTEETTFDRFRLNAKIDPRRFETVK